MLPGSRAPATRPVPIPPACRTYATPSSGGPHPIRHARRGSCRVAASYCVGMQAAPPEAGDREIIVAVVAPVGGPTDETLAALEHAFQNHDFGVKEVRISDLLDKALPTPPGDEALPRVLRLMNKGDRFRAQTDDDAACAYMAAQAISLAREQQTGSVRVHRPKHVNLVRSLKTPEEVQVLRSIYGDRAIVVGVSASRADRRRELARVLKEEGIVAPTDLNAKVEYLLDRDEKDYIERHGQRASEAYRLADAFVATRTKVDEPQVERLVELLLGAPFITPSRDEYGMFHAFAAKLRSSAAGRQVGAAIVDLDGEIVAVGCNDVPKPGGGQYWEGDKADRRDFQLGYDANDRGKFGVALDVLQGLAQARWLARDQAELSPADRAEAALGSEGPLRKTQVDDLIEYGRIVHAEMAAILTAARSGRAIRGCTLYTTTYPCHECFRLIIGAGIARVSYVDPYQKSRAPELFAEMLHEGPGRDPVVVEPFVGVSPRLFARAFEMSNRTKGLRGEYLLWERKALLADNEEIADSIPDQEEAAAAYLAVRVAEADEQETATRGDGRLLAEPDAHTLPTAAAESALDTGDTGADEGESGQRMSDPG